jgi:hypothetical protein
LEKSGLAKELDCNSLDWFGGWLSKVGKLTGGDLKVKIIKISTN